MTSSANLRLPPTSTLKWTTSTGSTPATVASSVASSFIQGLEDNINYDLMLAAAPGDDPGQTSLMADGEQLTLILTLAFDFDLFIAIDRYFQCEPMDATVSPIALTSHSGANVVSVVSTASSVASEVTTSSASGIAIHRSNNNNN